MSQPEDRPGSFPYTRGIRADGYRTRPWTMRVPFAKADREPGYERLEAACVEGEKGAAALLKEAQH